MQNRLTLDEVTVQMTRASGPDGEPFRIRVTDRTSGVLVADIEIDEFGLANLMSSRMAYGTATVATEEQYARVGRERTVKSVKVPQEITAGIHGRQEAEAAIAPWAEEQRVAADADTYRIDSHNYGYSVNLSTWAAR